MSSKSRRERASGDPPRIAIPALLLRSFVTLGEWLGLSEPRVLPPKVRVTTGRLRGAHEKVVSSQRPGARIPEAAGLPWDVTGTSFVRKPRPNGAVRPASFHESLPQLREPRGCKHTGQGQGAFPLARIAGWGQAGEKVVAQP